MAKSTEEVKRLRKKVNTRTYALVVVIVVALLLFLNVG